MECCTSYRKKIQLGPRETFRLSSIAWYQWYGAPEGERENKCRLPRLLTKAKNDHLIAG